jgi:enoyl-CoA hydratase
MNPTVAVRCTIEGPVMTVTLSRPAQRNAVDGPTAALLREEFESFERDDALRVACSPAMAASSAQRRSHRAR